MMSDSERRRSIIELLSIVQWVLPIVLFFLAMGFEVAEHVVADHNTSLDPAFVAELAIFGLIGPISVWLVLRWVLQNQQQLEEANKQIHQMNADLEQRVAERTIELKEKNLALQKANQELQALDDLKSDFVSLVSHELRAPLTNINGGIELIARHKDKLPERKHAVLDILRSESERLTHLVQNILDVSLLETGKLQPVPGPIPLSPFLNTLLKSRMHIQSQHAITIDAPRDLPPVWADETHLADVVINLVDNAIKYSPPGSNICVSANTGSNGDGLIISVRDEGIGIPPHAQSHLFKQFYRANNSNDREVYGHGLGLYFCQKLVEAQDGKIWVDSSGVPGEGSTFSLSLPICDFWEDDDADTLD